MDGTYAFSRVQDVVINTPSVVTAYPNPVVSDLTIETNDLSKVKGIYLINAAGQKIAMSISSDKIDMSKVRAGIYILEVNQTNGAVSTTKIVKQ